MASDCLKCPGLVLLMALAGCNSGSDQALQPVPSPSHDLLFEGYLSLEPELLLRDAGSGSVSRLLPSGTRAMDPAPSPDGSRIAFVIADYQQMTGDIFLINRDGTGLTRLTVAPQLDDQPAWSPDGTRIAYRSYSAGREGDIWVMAADGKNPINLTPDPLPGVTDEGRPAWSPDGTRIAYASNAAGNIDIWTMAADGSDKRQITATEDLDTEPDWSPDGATIAFRRSSPGESDICLVTSAGGAAVPIPIPGMQRMPVWQPEGGRLVFVSQASLAERPDLYAVRSDGVELQPLVTGEVVGGSLSPAFLRRR